MLVIIAPSSAVAQVSCAGLPHDDGGTGFENWYFDTDTGSCSSNSAGVSSVTNGFRIRTDDDRLRVDRGYDAGVGTRCPSPDNCGADVTLNNVSPVSGGAVTGSVTNDQGVYQIEYHGAVNATILATLTVVKDGVTYTVTTTVIADDGTNHRVIQMIVTGGIFTLAPQAPNTRSKTQRVVANFIRRRADQITANDPDLVQRLNQSSDAEGGVPVNFTGGGTLDNNRFAFSSSLRQMLASKKVAKSTSGQNPSELMALGQSSVVSYGRPASGFDIWVQGKWAHVNDSAREHDIGLLYLGVDYRMSANLVVGFLAQLDHADENDSSQRSTVDGTGWLAGPYLVARLHKNLIFDARGAWGQSSNDIELSDTSSGSFDTTRWLGRGRLTGDFKQGLWHFAPHVGVIYFEDRQDRFTDSAGNTISSQSVSLGRFTFGPKISYSMSNAAGTVVTPHIAINGIWDFKNSEIVDVSTGLAAGSNDVRARVEGGVSARMANGWSINGTGFYDGIGANNLDIYGGSVKVRIPLH